MNKLMVRMSKKNKKGFTLVELIVVMAILAILAAILIPSVSGMIKRSNQAVDNATGRNLYMAGAMVAAQSKAVTVSIDNTDGYTFTVADGQQIVEDFIGVEAPTLKTATSMTLTVNADGDVTVSGTDSDDAAISYSNDTGSFNW